MNTKLDNDPSPPPQNSVITMARLQALSLGALALAVVPLFFICVQATQLADTIKIYEDFDTELPGLTLTMMRIPTTAYITLCFLSGVFLGVKEWTLRDKGVSLLINLAAISIGVGIWVLLERAITLPMLQVIGSRLD